MRGRWDFVERFGGDAGSVIPSRWVTTSVGGSSAATIETMTSSPTGRAMRLTGGTTNNDYMAARLTAFRAWNVEVLTRVTFGASEIDFLVGNIALRSSTTIGGSSLTPTNSIQCDLDISVSYGDTLTLQKGIAGSNTGIANVAFTASTVSRWVRFVCLGNNFYIRIWTEGTAEPSAWDIAGTDAATYLPTTGDVDNTYLSVMVRNRQAGVTNYIDIDQVYLRSLD